MTQHDASKASRLLTVAALMLLLAPVASAELYRWVDDNGQVHYSDKKPNQNEQRTSAAETLQFAPGTAAAKARRDRAAAEALEAEKVAERCGAARAQLETYRRAVSLVREDANGNEVELLPSERVELIERSQAKVAEACGEPAG